MITPLVQAAIDIALTQVGVREHGKNRGPSVDLYLRSVGLDPATDSYPWCASFVHWCFQQAAAGIGAPNPCPKTAGAIKMFLRAEDHQKAQVPTVGSIFVISHGQGKGHCGLVTRVMAGEIETIEGNTSLAGSREGDGVYARRRNAMDVNVGFVDLSRPDPAALSPQPVA